MRRRIVATLLASIGALATTLGLAGGARGPATAVVGPPHGFAPSDRLDAERRGRTSTPLPAPGSLERWRRELPGGIEVAPVVDAAGGVIVVLVTGEVIRLEPDGKPSWRRRLPCAPSTAAPVLTSDGSIALLCTDGSLQRVSADGKRSEVALHSDNRQSEAAPLARDDGSVIVASDEELIQVASDGSISARVHVGYSHPVGGLVAYGKSVLVTVAGGDVWQWQSPRAPERLGSFEGAVERGAALFGTRALVAVVGRDRVVAFDPLSRRTTLLADGAGIDIFEGPPALAPNGELSLTTLDGQLVGIDSSGTVSRRAPLENTAIFGDAGAPLTAFTTSFDVRESAPLIVDPKGMVAFARQSGRFGLCAPTDRVTVLDAAICTRPVALLPAGPGRIVVACSSGAVVMWGDQ